MTISKQRIKALEANLVSEVTPEVREFAERIAAEEDISADELIENVKETLRAIGPPHTVERYAAHVEKTEGIPADELLANMRHHMEMHL